ncbi:MAG: hypothetical protein ACWGNK_04225 [Desulfobacterales bacterium]
MPFPVAYLGLALLVVLGRNAGMSSRLSILFFTFAFGFCDRSECRIRFSILFQVDALFKIVDTCRQRDI